MPDQAEDFDTQYARAGTRCLHLNRLIRDKLKDFPADSSCGANADHKNKLNALQKQLFSAYMDLTL